MNLYTAIIAQLNIFIESLRRLEDIERPQVDGSLSDFVSAVTDHSQINFILDIPSGTPMSPDII